MSRIVYIWHKNEFAPTDEKFEFLCMATGAENLEGTVNLVLESPELEVLYNVVKEKVEDYHASLTRAQELAARSEIPKPKRQTRSRKKAVDTGSERSDDGGSRPHDVVDGGRVAASGTSKSASTLAKPKRVRKLAAKPADLDA